MKELARSFKSRGNAQQQCARDWPRMVVNDNRTFFQQCWDYLWGNELLDYFGNQSTMAKPFELAVLATQSCCLCQPSCKQLSCKQHLCDEPAFGALVVVQCSQTPFSLTIHSSDAKHVLTLRKRLVVKCLGTWNEGNTCNTCNTCNTGTTEQTMGTGTWLREPRQSCTSVRTSGNTGNHSSNYTSNYTGNHSSNYTSNDMTSRNKHTGSEELVLEAVVHIGSDTSQISFRRVHAHALLS